MARMLELELPLQRPLHCRMEFPKVLYYRLFYLIYLFIPEPTARSAVPGVNPGRKPRA